jgi:hypothetical protein
MNIEELEQGLLEEGCSPYNFSIGHRGSDVFCLEKQNAIWRVFYTERGNDHPPIFESMSEVEACEFYFDYITKKIRHDHLVGFSSRNREQSNWNRDWRRMGSYPIGIKSRMVAGAIRAIVSLWWGRIFSRRGQF